MKIDLRFAIVAFALLFTAATSHAATVTLVGDTVTYVYDDQTNAGALGLFGTPTIQGDVIRFLPPSFRAESTDGVGINTGTNTDVVSANFIFDSVYSNNGAAIGSITVTEFGDYGIVEGDRVALDLLLTASNNNDFTEFASASAGLDLTTATGAGLFSFLVEGMIMPEAEFGDDANDLALSIQNTLIAVTNAQGESAFIQKKLSLVATVVPLPGAVWMLLPALGALRLLRRRPAVVS